MKKSPLSITSITALTISSVATAGDFSYDYIEGGYQHDHYKGVYTDKNYQGVVVRGSKSINDTFYTVASYSHTEEEWSDPGEQEEQEEDIYTVGIGAHTPINNSTDGVAELSYVYWDRDWKQTSPTTSNKNYTDDLFILGIGARHNLTSETELNGGLELLRAGSLNADSELFYLGAMTEVHDGLSIGGTYRSRIFPTDDDSWDLNLVLRKDY